MSAIATAVKTMPPTSSPSDTQPRKLTFTPSFTSAATPFARSTFITTSDQLPCSTGQVIVGEVPVAATAQSVCTPRIGVPASTRS